MTQAEQQIHRLMTIEAILDTFPHKAEKIALFLSQMGLECVGCGASTWETLESGMQLHGFSSEDVDDAVFALNQILAEETDPDTISLTAAAAKKYLEILEREEKQGWGLRFNEKKAGCSGYEYTLDFSKQATSNDEIFTSRGVEIHVTKAMVPRLIGSEIDYVDTLQGAGFKVSNPNVRKSCGCGSSHNY